MTFRLAFRAQIDVLQIGDFIAARNPQAAIDLVEKFRTRWRSLAEHPLSGRAREDLSPGLRQTVVEGPLIFYRLVDGDVVIVRVMDGRRLIGPDETF